MLGIRWLCRATVWMAMVMKSPKEFFFPFTFSLCANVEKEGQDFNDRDTCETNISLTLFFCHGNSGACPGCSFKPGKWNREWAVFIQLFHGLLKALYNTKQHSSIHTHIYTPMVEAAMQGVICKSNGLSQQLATVNETARTTNFRFNILPQETLIRRRQGLGIKPAASSLEANRPPPSVPQLLFSSLLQQPDRVFFFFFACQWTFGPVNQNNHSALEGEERDPGWEPY